MDTEQIINELMRVKNFTQKKQLAEFMGEKPQTINTWIQRNRPNNEKILAAFPNLNANWLLTGEGSMFKKPVKEGGKKGKGADSLSDSSIIIERLLNEIAQQRQVIESLVEQNKTLLRLLDNK